jgi:hypothetical protein
MKQTILLTIWIILGSSLSAQASLLVDANSSFDYRQFARDLNYPGYRLNDDEVGRLKDFALEDGQKAALISLVIQKYWGPDVQEKNPITQFKRFLSQSVNEANIGAFRETGLFLLMKPTSTPESGFLERKISDAHCNLAGKLILDHLGIVQGHKGHYLYFHALSKFVFADLEEHYVRELTLGCELYTSWLTQQTVSNKLVTWQKNFRSMIKQAYATEHTKHHKAADNLFRSVEERIRVNELYLKTLNYCGLVLFLLWYRAYGVI